MESGLSFQDEPSSLWRPMFDTSAPPDLTEGLSPVVLREALAENPSDKDLQRANGCGRIVLSGSERGTRVVDIF